MGLILGRSEHVLEMFLAKPLQKNCLYVHEKLQRNPFVGSGLKRASLLGNEGTDLGGDSPFFEYIYPNLEQRSIFAKKINSSLCQD